MGPRGLLRRVAVPPALARPMTEVRRHRVGRVPPPRAVGPVAGGAGLATQAPSSVTLASPCHRLCPDSGALVRGLWLGSQGLPRLAVTQAAQGAPPPISGAGNARSPRLLGARHLCAPFKNEETLPGLGQHLWLRGGGQEEAPGFQGTKAQRPGHVGPQKSEGPAPPTAGSRGRAGRLCGVSRPGLCAALLGLRQHCSAGFLPGLVPRTPEQMPGVPALPGPSPPGAAPGLPALLSPRPLAHPQASRAP